MFTMELQRHETFGSEWRHCSAAPQLEPGDAHVWKIVLEASPDELLELESLLNASERERAARYRFERLRSRFIVGRASLRILLGQYLDRPPRELVFSLGAHGKPAVEEPGADPTLYFNLSHSENMALLAVSQVGATGVDVEQIRPMRDARELVARFFSPRENREFSRLSEAEQPQAFFNLWTRKEALLKATGEGIAFSLNKVEVTFRTGEPARLLALPGNAPSAKWFLKHLEPAPGYTGALVLHGQPQTVQTYTFKRQASDMG